MSSTALAENGVTAKSLFVDLSQTPDARNLHAFELCVLASTAEVDLEPGHSLGNRFYAMLNVAQISKKTYQAATAEKLGLRVKSAGEEQSIVSDPSDDNWLKWALTAEADPAAKKGFDGFILTLGPTFEVNDEWRVAVLELAQILKKRYQDKEVLLDSALGIGAEAAGVVDGLLALGVHTSRTVVDGVARAQDAQERLPAMLHRAAQRGMRVLAVDFGQETEREQNQEKAAALRQLGALPFVTTRELRGANLGPQEEIVRRVLVLHGWDAAQNGSPAPAAASTVTARCLHAPLEWLGCEVEYLTFEKQTILPTDHLLRGVVLDPSLILDAEQQAALVRWLLVQRERRVPLLLAGMPWRHPMAAEANILSVLGLGGSCALAPRLERTRVAHVTTSAMRSGALVSARALSFMDVQASEGARLILSTSGTDALGSEHRFDQVFHADWGSVWLEPAALTAGPLTDLYSFAATWLGNAPPAPVPDTTTLEGRQIFFSVISSEGFAQPSTQVGYKRCAEIMRQQVLSHFHLPFTIAICEADLRGINANLSREDAAMHEQSARSIFELPNVSAASNSSTRPVNWTLEAANHGGASSSTGSLSLQDIQREVAGSMSYIHQQLLPAGKGISLMVWPRGATPSAEALAFCQQIGVPSLTPGPHLSPSTVLSPDARPRSATGIAFGDTTEVFASTMSGDEDVSNAAAQMHQMQSLVASSQTRRVAAAGLHLNFHAVQDERRLAATQRLFDWCTTQPFIALTAAEHVASVRDALSTRIIRVAADHWIVLNDGLVRTLRLPIEAGLPDMSRCRGIHGYKTHAGQLYIHTTGAARSEIVLTKKQSTPWVHLVESSASVEFLELSARRGTFQVRDWRPVQIVLGGFQPGGQCAYRENGRPHTTFADQSGIVRFEVARQAVVSFQSLAPANNTAAN
ncbi:MAG: hypothetical protein IPK32_26085 [Verrucomicrobiaceae bacterium]|nr:hypothetical protein [Verrucomicrobiaceae bacterium]